MVAPDVSETLVRVNYSETDQMGVVYHARYLVWLDVARTEHLRLAGMSYRELEAAGLRLVVERAAIRYRQPARTTTASGSAAGCATSPPGGSTSATRSNAWTTTVFSPPRSPRCWRWITP